MKTFENEGLNVSHYLPKRLVILKCQDINMGNGEKNKLKNLKTEGGYLASACASLSPVKLTDEPSNFLTTTDSTVLESLSLYLISKRLRKTLGLSHLLLQYTSGVIG